MEMEKCMGCVIHKLDKVVFIFVIIIIVIVIIVIALDVQHEKNSPLLRR